MGDDGDSVAGERHRYDELERVQLSDGSYAAARHVVPLVVEVLHPGSVVDVGCGTGGWLRGFLDAGIETIHGFDGDDVPTDALLIDPSCFEPRDLRRPLAASGTYDLVVSIEVGEHLPAERAAGFVADLCAFGDAVLFSAAIPGAARVAVGGPQHSGHINEQWPSYWASLFEGEGFRPYDLVRPVLWDRRDVAIAVRQHLLLYARDGSRAAATLGEHGIAPASYVDVVHPQWVEVLMAEIDRPGLRQMAKLPGAVGRALSARVPTRR